MVLREDVQSVNYTIRYCMSWQRFDHAQSYALMNLYLVELIFLGNSCIIQAHTSLAPNVAKDIDSQQLFSAKVSWIIMGLHYT